MSDFHVDFAVILTALTLLTGVVWGLDKWVLAPRREQQVSGAKPNAFVDFCRSFSR